MTPFAIVGMPRTGSTLLWTGLAQHPEISAFGELFHPVQTERAVTHAITHEGQKISFDADTDDAIEFLKRKVFPLARRGSKACGFKVFAQVVQCRGTDKLFSRLKYAFPELRIIHIIRQNYLDVLVSRRVAATTNDWIQYAGQQPSGRPQRVRIEPDHAQVFFSDMHRADRFFESFFGGANYFKVEYNALASDFSSEMKRIYRFLGVSEFTPTKKTEKQISSPLSEIVENYEELRKAFSNTEYRKFIAKDIRAWSLSGDTELRIGDFVFDLDASPAVKTKRSTSKHFVLMKSSPLLDEYKRLFDELAPANIMELGIRRGGSMAFFNLAFSPQNHVGIEIEEEPIPALVEIVDRARSEGRRMSPIYGVDQGDKEKLLDIVRGEFGDGGRPLDVVIDDASHKLNLSTASFEVLFPLIREGGVYAVEDWAWAHWQGFQGANAYLADEPALTNLIFQLLILHACQPTIIRRIIVTPVITFFERGPKQLNPLQFRVADNLVLRGKKLSRI